MSTAIAPQPHTTELPPSNPFATPSPLPFHAPPFDRIRDTDFEPAIEAGMAAQLSEISTIADNPDPPTFSNTLEALERSGLLLDRTLRVFGALAAANTNPTLQAVQQAMAPRLAAHADAITLNPALFTRIHSLHQLRATLPLTPEQLRLLEITHRQFVHAGALLDPAGQARLRELNEEESTLSTAFRTRLLAANKAAALHLTDPQALAGLSPAELAAAEAGAHARNLPGFLLPLHNTTQQPALATLTNRETRRALFAHSLSRTEQADENDTRDLIARLAQLRSEKATLLGFPTYAAWKLDDQMAHNPAAVQSFLQDLAPKALADAAGEASDLQTQIDHDPHARFSLEPWDWELFAEQLRRARFDLDEETLKPFFELTAVLERGVFHAATLLFGLSFHERHDLPTYAPGMRVFEVHDADTAPIALVYVDLYKRDNKSGGAWMSSFVGQSQLLGTLPVIYNVANLTPPAPGEPTLLAFDDVITLFHEFGHALHGLFSTAVYPSLSGTAVPRDFVEFPSQFNEFWATDPAVFRNYARHHATGEPMPDSLRDRLLASRDHNEGYKRTELLAAAQLDQAWHTLTPESPLQQPAVFEAAALAAAGLDHPQIPPRYRSTFFAHIWGGGYAAGYYAYLWAESLEHRAIQWFRENGGLTRANGDRLRHMILARGNTQDLQPLFDAWCQPQPQPIQA